MTGDQDQAEAADAGATLARVRAAGGTTTWTLTVHAGGRATSRGVDVERLTGWSGPCSNEIAYRCTLDREGSAAAIVAGGLATVTVEGRGEFTVRRADPSQDGRCRIELHRRRAAGD